MTMMQKMQAKKSKKGFTLVELVIVIAILAILAAIAIPVITTTINSAKLSTLESDAKTVDMMLKEACNNYLVDNTNTKYSGAVAADATVGNVLAENNLPDSVLDNRQIGGTTYCIGWTNESAVPSGGDYGDADLTLTTGTAITDLVSK